MNYLIQQYLYNNGLTGVLGKYYILIDRCEGGEIEIGQWLLPIEKPSFTSEEIKAAKTQEKKENLRKKLIDSRLNYLTFTDWYIAREIDKPNTYPTEIKNKRNLAREEINKIESCSTLTQLNQFDEVFE